jgi:hypothetical protein
MQLHQLGFGICRCEFGSFRTSEWFRLFPYECDLKASKDYEKEPEKEHAGQDNPDRIE